MLHVQLAISSLQNSQRQWHHSNWALVAKQKQLSVQAFQLKNAIRFLNSSKELSHVAQKCTQAQFFQKESELGWLAPGKLAKTGGGWAHSGRVVGGAPPSHAGFDSLAVLANGNIAVATLTTGKITEFSPQGAIVREVAVPDVFPTNICFGGADMKTAYITLSDTGRLGVMRWPTPGLKLNFN